MTAIEETPPAVDSLVQLVDTSREPGRTAEGPPYRFKTRARRHRWTTVGGYDPELDGDDEQWGRIAITCALCGENRRVWRGVSFDNDGLRNGCVRTSASPDYMVSDLVVVGERLDYFVSYHPDGRALTRNAGNDLGYVELVSDLQPYW